MKFSLVYKRVVIMCVLIEEMLWKWPKLKVSCCKCATFLSRNEWKKKLFSSFLTKLSRVCWQSKCSLVCSAEASSYPSAPRAVPLFIFYYYLFAHFSLWFLSRTWAHKEIIEGIQDQIESCNLSNLSNFSLRIHLRYTSMYVIQYRVSQQILSKILKLS